MKITFGRSYPFSAILLTICLLILEAPSGISAAADLTLAWDANADPNVAGYKLYYGKASRTYDVAVDVGKVTQFTLTGLEEGKAAYFAVTAYDMNRNESAFSTELECFTLVPSAGTNGAITPEKTIFVSRGMNQTFRILPANGFTVSSVRVDTVPIGPAASYSFQNIDRNHTISASFAAITPTNGSLSSFNGDSKPDLLLRNTSSGEIYVLYLDGVSYAGGGGALITVADPGWTIVGTGDFSSDGKPDLLWRNTITGENCILFLGENSYTGVAFLPPVTHQGWAIVGAADFSSDGKTDILWRNTATGENLVWFMDESDVAGWDYLPVVSDTRWMIAGTGDFNGDGQSDILWRNTSTGDNAVAYMKGISCADVVFLPPIADLNCSIVGTGDFNGDGNLDILWWNFLSGENYVWFMNGATYTGGAYLPPVVDPNWSVV